MVGWVSFLGELQEKGTLLAERDLGIENMDEECSEMAPKVLGESLEFDIVLCRENSDSVVQCFARATRSRV